MIRFEKLRKEFDDLVAVGDLEQVTPDPSTSLRVSLSLSLDFRSGR